MDTKAKIVLLLNLVFVALLLLWPLMTAPKIQISLNKETVPLGGKLGVTAILPGVPTSVKLSIVDLELNRTVESLDLNPAKEVSASIEISEGKYRIGHYAVRISANVNGGSVEEEKFFSVFGAAPLNLSLEVEKPELKAFINVTAERLYAEVNDRVRARVTMNGQPVNGAKLLAVALGSNATITDVAYTDVNGEAVLEWKANVTENTTYTVVVQAVKPGHPIASGEVQIKVNVEKGG